jgi:hypothetical protein
MIRFIDLGKQIGPLGEDDPDNDIRNANALREAENAVAAFEKANRLSSEEMLACLEGDERLAKIDGFDLMDWHYALEQTKRRQLLPS